MRICWYWSEPWSVTSCQEDTLVVPE